MFSFASLIRDTSSSAADHVVDHVLPNHEGIRSSEDLLSLDLELPTKCVPSIPDHWVFVLRISHIHHAFFGDLWVSKD